MELNFAERHSERVCASRYPNQPGPGPAGGNDGRPRKLSEMQIAKALRQHEEKGLAKADIAARLGVSERTLTRRFAETDSP